MLVVNDIFFKFFDVDNIILDDQVITYENVWVSCSKLHLVPLFINTWSSKCVIFSLWNNTYFSSSLVMYNSLLYRVPQALPVSFKNFFCLALAMIDLARSIHIGVCIQDDGSQNEALTSFFSFHLHPNKSFLFELNGDIDIFCQLRFPITFGF